MSQLAAVLEGLSDIKTVDRMVYDVQSVNPFHDYIVLSTATNKRQLQASIKRLKDIPLSPDDVYAFEGSEDSSWVLMAIGNTIVHLFLKDERDYYHLEKLWFDIPHWTVDDES